jgi:glycerophosphoryl diester phosphodiesterase
MSPFKLSFEVDDPFLPSASEDGRIRVIGHRGAPAPGRPENSVVAVTEALLQGADGVEVDVWLTEDGTLVCAHDLPDVFDRSSLATLPELLAAVRDADGAQVVVEAKPVSDAAVAARTASALADVLRSSAGNAAITVSSFDPALLAMIRATCADLPVRTALLGDKWAPAAEVVRRAHEDGHDEVHLPLVAVRRTPEAVGTARSLGLSVSLWTVNGRSDLQWVAELGVDAVITDDVLTAWSELDRATVIREMVAA